MKPFFDLLQIALQTDGINYVVVIVGILALWIAINTIHATVKLSFTVAREILPKITLFRSVLIGILSIFAVANVQTISDYIQYLETKSEAVTEHNGFSTSKTVAIFEAELRRNTLPDEYNTITDSIQAWRVEFGMDSTAAYECMVCECALNPFIVRKDGIAAGPIQFTANGCDKMPFKLDDVKAWCKNRDAERLMYSTGCYLRFWGKNKRIKTGLDFYITVFAPGYLGFGPEKVLYNSGDAYRLNAGMDGLCVRDGIIVRHPSAINGDITIQDVGLWQKYKVGQLIKRSLKIKN